MREVRDGLERSDRETFTSRSEGAGGTVMPSRLPDRSERQLMRHAADRLSVRWYLGYNLGEPLPDHSSLTKIRNHYGVEVFRRFFEAIVEQCQQEKLVWGKELCAIRSLETVC